MPDVQKVDGLIDAVIRLTAVVSEMNKRHGSFSERDELAAITKSLQELKNG